MRLENSPELSLLTDLPSLPFLDCHLYFTTFSSRSFCIGLHPFLQLGCFEWMHKLRCIIVYADDMQTYILCNKDSHAKVGLVLPYTVYSSECACVSMHRYAYTNYFPIFQHVWCTCATFYSSNIYVTVTAKACIVCTTTEFSFCILSIIYSV